MQAQEHSAVRIGGMLVGYVLICPRKAWLSMQGIWMEQESESVALGRLVDAASYGRADKHLEIEAEAPDGTLLVGRIDRANLRGGVLHETKKGRACEQAHLWQVRFYLWLLHRAGVARRDGTPFRGRIDYPLLRRGVDVALEEEDMQQLEHLVGRLRALAASPTPPARPDDRRICKACAYEELCYG